MPKPLKFLAFDTSTEHMSVALTDGVRVWRHCGPGGAQASGTLIPAILALLAKAKVPLPSPAQGQTLKPNKTYNPCHPERTLLNRTVAEHFKIPGLSWPPLDGSTARVTTAPRQRMSRRRFANIWSAAFSITALPACQCASGCCRYPNACAITCSVTRAHSMRHCASFCGWCSRVCYPLDPALQRLTRCACTWAQWLSSTALAPA